MNVWLRRGDVMKLVVMPGCEPQIAAHIPKADSLYDASYRQIPTFIGKKKHCDGMQFTVVNIYRV